MSEQWLPVPGFSDYDVSDHGRVRSWKCGRDKRPRVLSDKPGRHGYVTVMLVREGERRPFRVHRLVLMAFVGKPKAGQEACHNNGARNDNRLCNLRWDTYEANRADMRRHGNVCRGERRVRNGLTGDKVIEIREECARGARSYREIGEAYGLPVNTIARIASGTTWAHAGGPRTQRGNQDQCKERGEARKLARLTEADVREIRAKYATGGSTQRGLAEQFGVSQRTVANVIHRTAWAHVD